MVGIEQSTTKPKFQAITILPHWRVVGKPTHIYLTLKLILFNSSHFPASFTATPASGSHLPFSLTHVSHFSYHLLLLLSLTSPSHLQTLSPPFPHIISHSTFPQPQGHALPLSAEIIPSHAICRAPPPCVTTLPPL